VEFGYGTPVFKPKLGVRARILAIALVPSAALLAGGATAAGILVSQGMTAQAWSSQLTQSADLGLQYGSTLQEERKLTLLKLAGDQASAAALPAQRVRTDSAFEGMARVTAALTAVDQQQVQQLSAARESLTSHITALRQQVDAGTANPLETYAFYNQVIDALPSGMAQVGSTAPDAEIAATNATTETLFRIVEAMSRSTAIGAAATASDGMDAQRLLEYNHQVGSYHTLLDATVPKLQPSEQQAYQSLLANPSYQQIVAMESAIAQRGTQAGAQNAALPLNAVQWQAAAADVDKALVGLLLGESRHTNQLATDYGARTARNSMLGGGAVTLLAVAAFLIALRLSNRLVRRLKRLRGETLTLADERLPEIMSRLRDGEQVALDTEMAPLNHGTDEIGQVADAFNRAQHAAVSAAITEAKTREGVNAVFLNIAHRSQMVVHRQLEILDKAEYEQEDPAQLDMLFQLDHLATRERRNAENLIILGGEQPGRQWRNPVPLVDVVRSAVAETEHYARVRTARLPDMSVVGNVVADLIHLLAELVDNATSFSPPESRVEVSGNVVGKGVVVEIADQGLGMSETEMVRVNETLRNPPDFTVATLSSDSRLGMFVVAQLAARNEVQVRLVESDYGGVRAIVLIPTALIAVDAPITDSSDEGMVPRRRPVSLAMAGPQKPARTERALAAVVSWPPEETAPPPPAPPPPPPPPAPRAQREADDRPVLPRRRRQANLAPQLARSAREPASRPQRPQPPQQRPQTAERARDLLSAIESGTRQGRHTRPPDVPGPNNSDEREGHGGFPQQP
jgi:signal transduction histidine kinase